MQNLIVSVWYLVGLTCPFKGVVNVLDVHTVWDAEPVSPLRKGAGIYFYILKKNGKDTYYVTSC